MKILSDDIGSFPLPKGISRDEISSIAEKIAGKEISKEKENEKENE